MPESPPRLCGSASKSLTSDAIRNRARELGFDVCGVAPAQAFPELAFFKQWIDRGYAGTMGYLPRSAERRSDVRNVVPSARSVIVTGTLYNCGHPYSPSVTMRRAGKLPDTRGAATITTSSASASTPCSRG